jgi:hypothetical protein
VPKPNGHNLGTKILRLTVKNTDHESAVQTHDSPHTSLNIEKLSRSGNLCMKTLADNFCVWMFFQVSLAGFLLKTLIASVRSYKHTFLWLFGFVKMPHST